MSTPSTEQRPHLTGQPEAELIQTLLTRLQIPRSGLTVVGDGSGSTWERGCGWASILIDHETRGRRAFFGAMNLGSVNFAEAMPYVQALNWFDAQFGKERLKRLGSLPVHILTDSQVTAQWGTQASQIGGVLPRKHAALWAAMREYQRLGYQCVWHWAPRLTTELNWLADLIAGLSRRGLEEYDQDAHDLRLRAINALQAIQFCPPGSAQPLDPYGYNSEDA